MTAVRRLALIFFASGAAGLFYEVIFSKSLALTFGSTAVAATTVLATYMGGMALGSWLGGKVTPKNPVRAYALCEVGVAIWCASSPLLLHALRGGYVALGGGPALRVLLGSCALLPPTLLMGMTLPFLVRDSLRRGKGLGDAVGILYGANTLGAAAGALLAGYAILPLLGVFQTTLLAVALNLMAALLSLRVAAVPEEEQPNAAAAAEMPTVDRRVGIAAIVVLTIGGAVTLALETTYVHLLAVVAGNSAFAFSLMLFSFLAGLGLGAAAGRRRVLRSLTLGRDLALCELLLAAVLLAGVFYWDRLPLIFLSGLARPFSGTFAGRELIRFVTCVAAMLPPAVLIGVAYPMAMELVGRAWPDRKVEALGRAAALNTVGNVGGALLGGFFLLPLFGSLDALHALAAVSMILALFMALVVPRREQLQLVGGAAVVAALFVLQPASFDMTRLASGINVYFAPQQRGPVIDFAESLDGGLTSVHKNGELLTLNTNGKFQGNNAGGGEMIAQIGLAVDPLLHVTRRDLALVIGFGTGTSTHVVDQAGFGRVDLAELSADILALADRHFRRVNGGVLASPRVHTHVADGRNFLLLSRDRYDLISMEISSIWFAGAASLYSRDFYRLVRAHLAPKGVLQQWVQLHHISTGDLLSVLATVHETLPRVWLYETGGQGIIIACADDCPPNPANLDAGLEKALARIGMVGSNQLRDQLLGPAEIDHMLARVDEKHPLKDLISTDDNLRLEYSTPRGNVLDGNQSQQANERFLARFRTREPVAGSR